MCISCGSEIVDLKTAPLKRTLEFINAFDNLLRVPWQIAHLANS